MAGAYSQMGEQKSFAVFARSDYGSSTMAYPFFENRPYTEYKSVLLRKGGRDKSKLNEAVVLGLVDGKLNVVTQAFRPYVLYINGKYWGVYYMMEKRNKYMIADHEGASDPDSMNILTGSGTSSYSILQGTNEGYKEIFNYVTTHDMTQKESYDYVAAHIDTDSFMDEMIGEIWVANNDPGNLQFYQILPDGKWKQVYYDFCISFGAAGNDFLALRRQDQTAGSTLFNALLSYKPWRDKFIERFAWALKEVFSTERVTQYINDAADAIRSEIPSEKARFSDTLTVDEWNADVNDMLYFAKVRNGTIVQQLKNAFDLSPEQEQMLDDAVK
jgi:hypothetical protein